MAEPSDAGRPSDPGQAVVHEPAERPQPGWPQVALVAVACVVVVLGLSAVSAFIPGLDRAFFGSPLMIALLIVGTVFVVWRILRAPTAPR